MINDGKTHTEAKLTVLYPCVDAAEIIIKDNGHSKIAVLVNIGMTVLKNH